MSFDTNGNSIIEADVKNFRVSHPTQPETDIVYACIEGPEAAAYLRGTGRLVNGQATIALPDHFAAIGNHTSMTVQVTALSSDSLGLSVVAKEPSGFTVKELHRGSGNYDFDWEVKCVRKGHEDYRVTRPRSKTVSLEGLARSFAGDTAGATLGQDGTHVGVISTDS
jgi:hypothetical protein